MYINVPLFWGSCYMTVFDTFGTFGLQSVNFPKQKEVSGAEWTYDNCYHQLYYSDK